MNNQAPIEHPELTIAYREGEECRRHGYSKTCCPWDFGDMKQRHLWLAGWHQKDIEMSERRLQ